MTADVIKFRLRQRTKPGRQVAGRDFLILREDGTLGFVPKGTVLSNHIEAGLPEIAEDLQAEQRLAQAAMERD